jgi:hypothetical protein
LQKGTGRFLFTGYCVGDAVGKGFGAVRFGERSGQSLGRDDRTIFNEVFPILLLLVIFSPA